MKYPNIWKELLHMLISYLFYFRFILEKDGESYKLILKSMHDIEAVSCIRFQQYFNINDVKTGEYVLILAGNRYFRFFFNIHELFF